MAQKPERDLKAVLMILGNKLVKQYGYKPSGPVKDQELVDLDDEDTQAITVFCEFLNRHSDAREILEEQGFKWSLGR